MIFTDKGNCTAKNNRLEVVADTAKLKTAEEVGIDAHSHIARQMRTEKSREINVPEIDR